MGSWVSGVDVILEHFQKIFYYSDKGSLIEHFSLKVGISLPWLIITGNNQNYHFCLASNPYFWGLSANIKTPKDLINLKVTIFQPIGSIQTGHHSYSLRDFLDTANSRVPGRGRIAVLQFRPLLFTYHEYQLYKMIYDISQLKIMN